MGKIITFGDSHSFHAWPDYVIQNHLGPKTAHSFGEEIFECLDLTNYDINDGDHLIFCFGEIDCRCYIGTVNNPIFTETIEDIVQRYVNAVEQNLIKLNKNVNVWLYNAVPATPLGYFEIHPLHPVFGSDIERRRYTEFFNMILSEYVKKKNWGFFDVYDKYVNEDGFMNLTLSDYFCHVKNNIYLEEFINKNILIR